MNTRFWRRMAVSMAVVVVWLANIPTSSAQVQAPTLQLSAETVNAGERIDIRGAGFIPGERLSVWVTAANQIVLDQGFQGARDDGTVAFDYDIPGDAESGTWAITVYGQRSQAPAIARWTVIGQPPVNAGVYAGVSPEVGTAGTYFTFFALDYEGKEKYSYWFTGPDNVVYDPHSQEARADKHGRVEFTWQAPANLPPGRYVATIQGVRSGVARGVVFELR